MNKLNAPLLETDEVKIFEIGNVFTKPARAGGNGEELHVAYADKKGVKEVKLDEYASPEIVSERSSDLLSSRLTPQAGQTVSDPIPSSAFKLWSPYPFITRDIAVWVPEGTDAKVLEDIYKKNGGELMALAPRLVDTFTKDGRTSYAFRLVFQAMDRTLTDSEVNSIMENINQEIFTHTDFEIR
jgi:phenylalanyl-tRNA synthetase beta subunit